MKGEIALSIILLSLLHLHCGNTGSTNKHAPEKSIAEIKFRTEEGVMGQIPAKGTSDYNFVFFQYRQ